MNDRCIYCAAPKHFGWCDEMRAEWKKAVQEGRGMSPTAAWNTRFDGPKAVEMLDEMAACLKLAEERMCYLSGPSSEDEETRIAVMHAREVLQRYKGEGM